MSIGIDISYFVPFKLGAELCGENGLPMCPYATRIIGRAEVLKSVRSKSLQQFVDLEQGQQERLIIAQAKFDSAKTLDKIKGALSSTDAIQLTIRLVQTIDHLHQLGFQHHALSSNLVWYDNDRLVLLDWWRWTLTGCGEMAPFKGDERYAPPEELVKRIKGIKTGFDYSGDIYSIGMIITELLLGVKLWRNMNEFDIIRKRLSFVKSNFTNSAEALADFAHLSTHFNEIDPAITDIVKKCTSHIPSQRPTSEEILKLLTDGKEKTVDKIELFDLDDKLEFDPEKLDFEQIINEVPLCHLLRLWRLSGGDLDSELERRGLIQKQPGISRLQLVHDLGDELETNKAEGFFEKIELPLESIEVALSEKLTPSLLFPLSEMETEHKYIQETRRLPITIRENSVLYQFHRQLVYYRLLSGYPLTRELIIAEARVDLCPAFRGFTWCALLGVSGATRETYSQIDKDTRRETDRQIDVDIPRCHQYEPLIACPEGAHRIKRIIKSWLVSNPELTYWQGLDSLTTPFLYINYSREDLAWATMTKFIDKYMQGLFMRDNTKVIQEYLAVFQQLITFHDPELANHLADMEGQAFVPDLYAIPWFLTMFAHVFPIKKILYLWDTMLLQDSAFPLFIGVAIMTRLKRQLLSFTFNDCILSFSDMPDIDIHDVIKISLRLCRDTPRSCAFRVHQRELDEDEVLGMNPAFIDLDERKMEQLPRISPADICRLAGISRASLIDDEKSFDSSVDQSSVLDRIVIIDIRPQDDYQSGTLPGALSLPADSAFESPSETSPLGSLKPSNPSALSLIRARGKSLIAVCGAQTRDAQHFGAQLVRLGYPKVACMSGGFDLLDCAGVTLTVPSF